MPGQRFVPSPWDSRHAHAHAHGSPLETLSELLSDRFGRITGLAAVVAPLRGPARFVGPGSSAPLHPACRDAADKDACLQAWRGHLAQLDGHSGTHWHKCDQRRFCAVVPVTVNDRCLGVCKLVCSECVGTDEFLRHLGVLEMVVDNFTRMNGDCLAQWADRQDAVEQAISAAATLPVDPRSCHPQVRKALHYIDRHLGEVSLTVARIARALGINATYLAHLFSTQIGIRATQYITIRRIELAKTLLATTNWQVKRIAFESGHTNADWFSQVFRNHTGMSPREYRRSAREGQADKTVKK
jgi:AraC-like DNA-binding protein